MNMLKHVTFFSQTEPMLAAEQIAEALSEHPSRKLLPDEAQHVGFEFVLDRDELEETILNLGDASTAGSMTRFFVGKARIGTKKVPEAVLRRELQEQVEAAEEASGERLSPIEKKGMREIIYRDLLARAFTDYKNVLFWWSNDYFCIGAATQNDVRIVQDKLRSVLTTLPIRWTGLEASMPDTMREWLKNGSAPGLLAIGSGIRLADEASGQVIIANDDPVTLSEKFLNGGYKVERLELIYDDVSFTFGRESNVIRGMKPLFPDDDDDDDHDPRLDLLYELISVQSLIDTVVEAFGGVVGAPERSE